VAATALPFGDGAANMTRVNDPHQPLIVVAGHACVDLIPQLPATLSMTPNSLTRIGPMTFSTGGAVSNVGLALQRLGERVRLLAKVGDDALGKQLSAMLASRDPASVAHLLLSPGATTSYSVVVAPSGRDRLFWHCPGANDDFSPHEISAAALEGAAWLHFGYPPIMQKVYSEPASLAAMFSRVRAIGAKTSLDFCSVDPTSDAARVNWNDWLAQVLPETDLFCPSYDEMAALLGGEPVPTEASVMAISERLLKLGAKAVALKLGDLGLFYRDASADHYCPVFDIKLATATGAGDCTIAGLITGLATGVPVAQSLVIACGVGACSCEQPDATSGVPALDNVLHRIATGWKPSAKRLRASVVGL
jgi:sugar/nucleoside kinase (ribokinase family)